MEFLPSLMRMMQHINMTVIETTKVKKKSTAPPARPYKIKSSCECGLVVGEGNKDKEGTGQSSMW